MTPPTTKASAYPGFMLTATLGLMYSGRRGTLCFLLLTLLLTATPVPSRTAEPAEWDAVVDVTGMSGQRACASMQAALNDALTGYADTKKRVLIKGSLGSQKSPVDFSMFQNKGAQGAGGKPWPYSVCHAFWPIADTDPGKGVVEGYPDPLHAIVLKSSQSLETDDKAAVQFEDPVCQNFVFDRKRAKIVSGKGAGQMRRITGCSSPNRATLEREWETKPDSTSVIEVADWRNPTGPDVNLHVVYDLDVYYQNSSAQGKREYGVFADVGLHCYFAGASRGGDTGSVCLSRIGGGIRRSGQIRIQEFGRRDDGQHCRPTWPTQKHFMNRDYSIIWQALGPGVTRGADETELYIYGDGDLDNVGVLVFQTWTKDFERWRIRGIGTGVWISGSLNNTLYDPYIAENDFGVVIGSNEDWGTGWPRWSQCYTGNCDPDRNHWTGMNFRGGVVEGNRCGNFVMYGGYSGEVDRTFVEPGEKASPLYSGHSILVGAGVCDRNTAPSSRQKANRSGKTCGDDSDCGGTCSVNPNTKRTYAFAWDAVLASNRGDPHWYAFMLGKGTRSEFLTTKSLSARHIRVTGNGFGGEYGHGKPNLDFYPSEGAAAGMDASGAQGGGGSTRLPAYDSYVSMPFRDLHATIRNPGSGSYAMGTLMRRSVCTRVLMTTTAGGPTSGRWNLLHGKNRAEAGKELVLGGRALPIPGQSITLGTSDLHEPYLSAQSEVWLEIDGPGGSPGELDITLRCWEDG